MNDPIFPRSLAGGGLLASGLRLLGGAQINTGCLGFGTRVGLNIGFWGDNGELKGTESQK